MSSLETTPALTAASTASLPASIAAGSEVEELDLESEEPIPQETIKPNPGPAHPTHYLCRGGGRFTPMIALDELPPYLKVDGLPLSLSFKDIVDVGGAPCMPAVERAKECYTVILGTAPADTSSTQYMSPRAESVTSDTAASINIPSSGTINARLSRAIDGVGAMTDPEKLKQAILQLKANKGTSASQRYNPTTPGVLGQKVYCTHWMRTGECDFTQQGCMFLHAMPDLDTLELLGFRSYPRWFREMPRDFQLSNAKDFNEVGLDQHRHKQQAHASQSHGSNWYNSGNRYMPPRGPQGPGYGYHPQSPQMMPQRGPWPGYNGAGPGSPQPSGPYIGSPFSRAFSPAGFGDGPTNQPFYGAPDNASIWSRGTSPAMDMVNRFHKPLSPNMPAMYPGSPPPMMASPASVSSQMVAPFGNSGPGNHPGFQQRNNSQSHNGNGRAGILQRSGNRSRGKQSRRQKQNISPKTPGHATDKNPFAALSLEGSPGTVVEGEN